MGERVVGRPSGGGERAGCAIGMWRCVARAVGWWRVAVWASGGWAEWRWDCCVCGARAVCVRAARACECGVVAVVGAGCGAAATSCGDAIGWAVVAFVPTARVAPVACVPALCVAVADVPMACVPVPICGARATTMRTRAQSEARWLASLADKRGWAWAGAAPSCARLAQSANRKALVLVVVGSSLAVGALHSQARAR